MLTVVKGPESIYAEAVEMKLGFVHRATGWV